MNNKKISITSIQRKPTAKGIFFSEGRFCLSMRASIKNLFFNIYFFQQLMLWKANYCLFSCCHAFKIFLTLNSFNLLPFFCVVKKYVGSDKCFARTTLNSSELKKKHFCNENNHLVFLKKYSCEENNHRALNTSSRLPCYCAFKYLGEGLKMQRSFRTVFSEGHIAGLELANFHLFCLALFKQKALSKALSCDRLPRKFDVHNKYYKI